MDYVYVLLSLNVPWTTFIQEATSIPDPRVPVKLLQKEPNLTIIRPAV